MQCAKTVMWSGKQAASSPLPVTPKACLRHDAGRGRGWGERLGRCVPVAHARRSLAFLNQTILPRLHPTLTPPRVVSKTRLWHDVEGNRTRRGRDE
jgi:hypothetical protein